MLAKHAVYKGRQQWTLKNNLVTVFSSPMVKANIKVDLVRVGSDCGVHGNRRFMVI